MKQILEKGPIEATKYDAYELYAVLKRILAHLPTTTAQEFNPLKKAVSTEDFMSLINGLPTSARLLTLNLLELLNAGLEVIWMPKNKKEIASIDDRSQIALNMLKATPSICHLLCPEEKLEGLPVPNFKMLTDLLAHYSTYKSKLFNIQSM